MSDDTAATDDGLSPIARLEKALEASERVDHAADEQPSARAEEAPPTDGALDGFGPRLIEAHERLQGLR